MHPIMPEIALNRWTVKEDLFIGQHCIVCSAFGPLLGRCMMPSCYWAFVRFDLWSLFSPFFISLELDAAHGMVRKRQLVHRRRCCGARVCVFLVGRKHPVLFGCTIRTRTRTGSVCNALGLGPSFLRARTNEQRKPH